MAQDIKNLIEKIQQEGIQAGEEKSREIQEKAKVEAFAIVEKAHQVAEKMAAQAKEDIAKMEESSKSSLKQAGRDLLLSLRKEIKAMLDEIIVLNVRDALSVENLSKILASLIKESSSKDNENIIVWLKKEEAKELEQSFLAQLKQATKKQIILKASEDISGGFIISYDAGKSHFDFSDKALAQYLSQSIEPKLAELLKESTGEKK